MTDKEKKLKILNLLKQQVDVARYNHSRAAADEVGLISASKVWDEHNPDDGVGSFSQNPYRGTTEAHLKTDRYRVEYEKWQLVYDYAIENLIGD